jgi:hypothetical protein
MYLLVDLAASQKGEEVRGVVLEDRVYSGKGAVVVAEDVLESSLCAEDIEDGILRFVGLPAKFKAILVSFETFLEAVPLEQFACLNLSKNVLPVVSAIGRSSSNLKVI